MKYSVSIAFKIRAVRPDITRKNALSLARLPVDRINALRSRGLLNRGEANQTIRTLRALGECA